MFFRTTMLVQTVLCATVFAKFGATPGTECSSLYITHVYAGRTDRGCTMRLSDWRRTANEKKRETN